MKGLRKVLPSAVFLGGLLQQSTSDDIAYSNSQGQWAGKTIGDKASFVLSKFVSRVTFGSVTLDPNAGPVSPGLKLAGVFNKWTGVGVVALAYGLVGKNFRAPQTSLAMKTGTAAIAAGILGGFLDDPQQGSSSQFNPQISQQQNAQGSVWA